MAVPDNNIRYTRIETEVNEAIQDHPEIHDELIRYSWSRDSGVGGTYYAGLSHHSLCKTAITYKGFLGMGDGGFPTYGGYSIREFKGYDWENHGVIFFHHANYSTITGATFTNTTNDAYTLSYDSDDSSTFYVGATGRSSYFLGPVIAGTKIKTIFENPGSNFSSNVSHKVTFEINNFKSNASISSNNSSASGMLLVTISNGYHIDRVEARWELDNYHTTSAAQNGYIAAAYARTYRNGTSTNGYTYGTNKSITVSTDGGTNRGYTSSAFRRVTPELFGGTDLGNFSWSDTNSFISELSCQAFSPPAPQMDRSTSLKLNSGGYYGFTLRFYHSAATRDYTELQVRAAHKPYSSSNSLSGRKQMYATARSY